MKQEVIMRFLTLSLFASVVVSASVMAAQGLESQPQAAALAKRLGSSGPSAFAAPVPDDPSRFVAALHIPGVQLLVISAQYQTPALLRERLARSEHQQVYMDLNGAGERKGRFFVEDLGADGLRPDRAKDAPFDITWRDAVQRTMYNGDWREQKLSEDEYRERFAKDAAEYQKVLQILLDAHTAQMSRK